MPVLQQCTQLHNLIGKDSWILFKLLQSNTGASFFYYKSQTLESKFKLYLKVKARIKAIPVVNDASERALGLLTEFHDKLTCNSTAKQNIFKIIRKRS